MTQSDDHTLIEQTLAGDSTAFDALIRRHWQSIHRVVTRYLHDSDDSDDVLQDACAEAYQKLSTLQDRERFPQWLHAIVRNRCVSHLRKGHHHISYEETTHDNGLHVHETSFNIAADESLVRHETEETIHTAISKLPEKSRSVTVLHYLQGKSYEEIAALFQVPVSTIEGRLYRARKQLKEALLKMADIDDEALRRAIEQATKGLQEDIAEIKGQLWAVQREEDRWLDESRKAAGRAITQLPTGSQNPITWGIVGGYRIGDGADKRRISTWSSDSIDGFLNRVSNGEIAHFAGLFTDSTAVAVVRKLVHGQCTVAELRKNCEDESALAKALDHLEACHMITREDDLVEPVKDAITYFLTFLSMCILYQGHSGMPNYGNDTSHSIISQIAHDLAHDIPYSPTDVFDHLSESARLITLIQAIPLSLNPEDMQRFKEGTRLVLQDFNSAQQVYLRSIMESQEKQPKDLSSIALYLDPTHKKDDDHAHIVIEADNGEFGYHIDAFLKGTERAGWY